jgi:long-chain acyl-CoA synthetase
MRTDYTLAHLPSELAASSPQSPTVSDPDRSFTAEELDLAVAAARRRLAVEGVRRGDIVGLLLPNSTDFVVALFAAWSLGAAITPVNPALTPDEIEYQLGDAACSVTVTTTELRQKVPDRRVVVDLTAEAPADGADAAVDVRPDEIALVIYTSGTTGRPKGVMLSHANTLAMASAVRQNLRMDSTTRTLLVLPLFHVNGIMVSTLAPLSAGGSVFVERKFDPTTFFSTLGSVGATYFSGVPTIYALLLTVPRPAPEQIASLRFVICGAAPASAELLRETEQLLGVPVLEGYGLSEGSCASTINPLEGVRKTGTVGLAIDGQQVRVVDGSGASVAPGELGEVVVSGPTVMVGYLNRPEETARTVIDGWLHTGDIGRLDEDGYLTIVDRLKDMIIRGGENIYPKEIETAAYGISGVTGAAAVGKPDPVMGEVPVLFLSVSAGAGISSETVMTALRTQLARYKLPTEVHFLDALPTNAVGKVDKPRLRRLAGVGGAA